MLRGGWRWTLRTMDPDGTVRLIGGIDRFRDLRKRRSRS